VNLGELLKNAPAKPKADNSANKADEPEQKIDPEFEAAVEAESTGKVAEEPAQVRKTVEAEKANADQDIVALETKVERAAQPAGDALSGAGESAEVSAAETARPSRQGDATPRAEGTPRVESVQLTAPAAVATEASTDQTVEETGGAQEPEQPLAPRKPVKTAAVQGPQRTVQSEPAVPSSAATKTEIDPDAEAPPVAARNVPIPKAGGDSGTASKPVVVPSAPTPPQPETASQANSPSTTAAVANQAAPQPVQTAGVASAATVQKVQLSRDSDGNTQRRQDAESATPAPKADLSQPARQAPPEFPTGQITAQVSTQVTNQASGSTLASAQSFSADGAASQSGNAQPTASGQTSFPTTSTTPALAERGLVHQIVAAAGTRSNGGVVEVFLDPPELGRVEIVMEIAEKGVRAVLAAERPSTGDLIRRYSDLLQQQLEDAGFADVDLDFAQQDTDGQDFNFGAGPTTTDLPLDSSASDAVAPTRRKAQAGLVDLRL
jgi:hypothetical protein